MTIIQRLVLRSRRWWPCVRWMHSNPAFVPRLVPVFWRRTVATSVIYWHARLIVLLLLPFDQSHRSSQRLGWPVANRVAKAMVNMYRFFYVDNTVNRRENLCTVMLAVGHPADSRSQHLANADGWWSAQFSRSNGYFKLRLWVFITTIHPYRRCYLLRSVISLIFVILDFQCNQ